jgi:hypothetical protein
MADKKVGGYDLEGARKAEISDEDSLKHLSQVHNYDLAGARSAGISDEESLSHLAALAVPKAEVYEKESPEFFGGAVGVLGAAGAAGDVLFSKGRPLFRAAEKMFGFEDPNVKVKPRVFSTPAEVAERAIQARMPKVDGGATQNYMMSGQYISPEGKPLYYGAGDTGDYSGARKSAERAIETEKMFPGMKVLQGNTPIALPQDLTTQVETQRAEAQRLQDIKNQQEVNKVAEQRARMLAERNRLKDIEKRGKLLTGTETIGTKVASPILGGYQVGSQGAQAYNRLTRDDLQLSDIAAGATNVGGAFTGAASMLPGGRLRLPKAIASMGMSHLADVLDTRDPRRPKSVLEEKAMGGLVHLAAGGLGKRVVEQGGSKIMEILKDKMAPLYAKSAGVPARLPRAAPKTDAELFEFAERMAPQVRGDFVPAPGATTSVAGKTRAQFEREKGLQHDIRNVRGLTLKPSNYDEAAHQGKVKVGIAGDQTLTGKDVYGIAGNKLSSPSRQYGGSLYPAAHPLGWASEENAAQGVQNLVDTAAKQYGDVDVLGEFMKMGPEASNYAMHNADAIIKSINPAQVKQLDDLNRMIRAKFPDFAGIENQADILKQAEQNPELRKFLDYLVMTKKHAETYGLPSGADIRHALSEPDLRNLEIGASGKSIIEMVPGGKISPSSRKTTTTYSHDIPGDYLGGTKYARPYQLEFPDSYLALQNKITTVQDLAKQAVLENPELDPQTAIQYAKKYANQGFGGFRLAQPRQIMDQQYMDETGKYEDYMKQLLGFKEGGSTTPAWQRSEGKSPSGGLNALGRASYKRETGGELKAPQPEGGSRKKSFCARMGGMKKKLTSSKTANDPDSRINKALRKWKC